jgi:beta-glucosidase
MEKSIESKSVFGKSRKTTFGFTVVLILSLMFTSSVWYSPGPVNAAVPIYQDPNATVLNRVNDLLSRMTLDEKIGQMTQADRNYLSTDNDIATYNLGSLLSGGGSSPSPNTPQAWADMYDHYQSIALSNRLGIPIIYGIDAVHGHNNVYGATIFPHNIGLGATRNPALLNQIGQITAQEVAGTGIDWTFAPCLCVARDDRWGRTYESYGEDPSIAQSFTTIINGLQGTSLNAPGSILATAKHWIGDGGTTGGVDQGNTQISEQQLRNIHMPPYVDAIQKGVGSVMISYSSWNGQKMHGNKYLITDVLKTELGFKGFVVSDWAGINQLPGDYASDVRTSINAGIDMIMVPDNYKLFIDTLRNEVNLGNVPMSRIDDSVSRILTKKFELGLFEKPFTDRTYTAAIGSASHRAVARDAVRQSLVLLKNQNSILPLSKSVKKLFVAGKNADNIGNQSGGWTISWQGSSGNITPGTTILQGIKNTVSPGTTVTYNQRGQGIDSTYDAAIIVIGETPYAEGQGDNNTLSLSREDLTTLNTIKRTGVPIITVMVSGRPLIVTSQLPDWNAFVAAWLPGTEGNGVADVLFGDYKFTGKLPMTWPKAVSQEPINYGDQTYDPLFPFGFGLTYP